MGRPASRAKKSRRSPKTRSGYCPKCGGTELTSEFGILQKGDTSITKSFASKTCVKCGHKWPV